MKIAVVGTGYVGLVTGTCFAETGNTVTCIDIDKEKVAKLSGGVITIYEPGLEILFERNIKQGRLFFTTDLVDGIKDAQIIFLALPTPPGEDGSADLKYVLGVAEQLGSLLEKYCVIVDKSTFSPAALLRCTSRPTPRSRRGQWIGVGGGCRSRKFGSPCWVACSTRRWNASGWCFAQKRSERCGRRRKTASKHKIVEDGSGTVVVVPAMIPAPSLSMALSMRESPDAVCCSRAQPNRSPGSGVLFPPTSNQNPSKNVCPTVILIRPLRLPVNALAKGAAVATKFGSRIWPGKTLYQTCPIPTV